MKENELVSVVTLAGELVGKIISKSEKSLVLENPRMLVRNEQSQFGFVKGITISGIPFPKRAEIHNWILLTEPDPVFVEAYEKVLEIGKESNSD